jgi:putative spermidine/putrescine transport system ATP-binding protein
MTVALKLLNINKSYADVSALLDIKLEINDGEFFSLLGPSGSGKTTCLKVIAGFELPDTGQIELFGKDVSSIPPFKRDVNTVFQDYALFPHMNVKDNVAYSLKIKKTPIDQQEILINEILSTVKLIGYELRKPSELSGGQRQRVALARSLINKPKVLLLDEPLGALDLKLREQMQIELKNLQRQFQITFIYVTHDQQEAMSMSDRIAIFNEGRIEQIDTPKNIYNKPKSAFVADFIGTTSIIFKKRCIKIF